jgi:hypothetical protein
LSRFFAGNRPQTRMNAGLEHFFKNFSIFFKKTLKFPKPLPLPFLDEQKVIRPAKKI